MGCVPANQQLLRNDRLKNRAIIDGCLSVDDVEFGLAHKARSEQANVVEKELERCSVFREAQRVINLPDPRRLNCYASARKPAKSRLQIRESKVTSEKRNKPYFAHL